jgi:hypothetical protein
MAENNARRVNIGAPILNIRKDKKIFYGLKLMLIGFSTEYAAIHTAHLKKLGKF